MASRPFDLSKFRKHVNKSITGMSYGFNDPKTFLDTGSYALNYLSANRFDGGIPLEGKSTMFAGDSGSGKSYIVSANIIKDAQKKDIYAVVIDTENALDEAWMQNLDVDTNPEKLDKYSVATVDDLAKFLNSLIDTYREANDAIPYEDRPRLLIIIDSIGMLITPTQEAQFKAGDMKGDMGLKAKQITHMLRVVMAKIANQPIGIIFTNHVYDSQDEYKPDAIPGGKMLEFATSVIVQMNKLLLREDEDGNKLTGGEIRGIRSSAIIRKSRYSKPFERIKIDIPYDTGMDPYSGLFDLFEKKGLLVKTGNRWQYTSRETGEIFVEYRKKLKASGILDTIMKEVDLWEAESGGEIGFNDMENIIDPLENA